MDVIWTSAILKYEIIIYFVMRMLHNEFLLPRVSNPNECLIYTIELLLTSTKSYLYCKLLADYND